MKYFATTAALVSVIPGIVSLTINTPMSVVQCQPQLLSWSDGIPPYYLSIIPGGQPSAAPLKTFDTQNGNSLTWNVDIPAGTTVTFALKDSTGTTAYTDMVPIRGSDSSCVNGGAQTTAAVADAGSASTSGSSNSANSANPSVVATQGADASGPTLSGSASTTRASGAAAAATTARANASAAAPATTQSRAVATAGTTSAARPSSSSTSGAESVFTASGLGFAGIIGLAGAFFL